MKFKSVVLNKKRNVVLDCYILDDDIIYQAKERPAVIVMPGGGYSHLSHFEGEPVALEYVASGYHAFVLKYSVGKNYYKGAPLEDYEMAYEYIKNNQKEFRIMMDKIAVCGFSAGGHLASEASVAQVNRPNASILVYPVTSKESLDRNNMDAIPTIDRLDSNVPPTFIVTTATDRLVNPDDSLLYASKLVKLGVQTEIHMYYRGNHGFGVGQRKYFIKYGYNLASRVENWLEDSITWLNEIFNVHTTCPRYPISTDYSVYMPLSKILSNEKVVKFLKEEVPSMFDEALLDKGDHYPLIYVLEYLELSKESIEKIDNKLKELN